ncbi:MAG: UbiD family decarboxylase [Betaproteobacteria bacterium]|nr:UbiD family decarboxylase [Betaproteobacteria bacterium]
MTYSTMRDFLSALETKGLLRRIEKPVDPTWEPAALAKWMYQALPAEKRFGMLFEKVLGSDIPIATAALGANTATYAAALGVEPEGINAAWARACLNPIAPKEVKNAPCQEVVISGKDVRLSYLPIPVWTPGKDKGPYITTITATRDLDTGKQNMGVYRTLVRDEKTVVSNLQPGRHGYANTLTWTGKGGPAPIAWVIAAPPAVHLAAVARLPYGAEEIAIAGALMGAPVPMVKCKTVDLCVPAEAEIIVEGEVHPGETDMEGPFGEFAGYMGPIDRRPVVRITAITQRKNPIYYGLTSQMPPSESTTIQSLTNAGILLKTLRHDLGEIAVSDAFIDLTYGGLLAHAIVAMKPAYPGHAKKVGRLVAAASSVKRVTVVDGGDELALQPGARHHPRRRCLLPDQGGPGLHRSVGRAQHDGQQSDLRCDAQGGRRHFLPATEGDHDEGARRVEAGRSARVRDPQARQAAHRRFVSVNPLLRPQP